MSNNIIDKIQISGQSYDVKDSSAATVVELTQQEYDDLPSSAKTGNTLFVITDAQAGDLTNYYTKSETNTLLGGKADTATTYTKTEVDTALGGKQATLVSGTNIKTINNTSILGSGNIDIQGGGKAVSGGTNISITTGETADTINCTLPISGDSKGIYTTSTYPFLSTSNKSGNAVFGYNNRLDTFGSTKSSNYNLFFGSNNHISVNGSGMLIGGLNNTNSGNYTNMTACVALGGSNNVGNPYEFASGKFNVTHFNSTTFGDSGNTLFSVGNGTADNARHNAFEIRQNGDIYLTKDGQDVKLQDQLGGGITSGEVQTMIDESVSGKADTSAVTAVQDSLSGYVTTNTKQEITGNKTFIGSSNTNNKPIIFKQANDSHKIGFACQNSASTNNELGTFEFRPNTYTDSSSVKHPLLYIGHYRNNNTANAGVVQTMVGFRQYDQKGGAAYHYLIPLPAEAKTPFSLTTSFKNYFAPLGFKNGDTMITTDNNGVADFSSVLGGLKLVKLTQSEYDALATKDNSTLYIITDS